jgi:rhodanese-related sulfurtransferase
MTKLAVSFEMVDNNSINREIDAVLSIPPQDLLARGRQRAEALGLTFAGTVYPPEAWALVQSGNALLVDVRTVEELTYVGRVPETLNVPWKFGTAQNSNPRFLREFEKLVPNKQAQVLLLCRSGKRSAEAGEALSKAGYENIFNVLEGFEGNLNGNSQRGVHDGWRHWGLPWIQD